MREAIDWVALVLGYWLLICLGGFLTAFVYTLVHDAVKPWRKPTRTVPIPLVGYWDDEAIGHPHPLNEPTLHVEAPDFESALKALERAS